MPLNTHGKCTKIVKKVRMTEPRECILSAGHGGSHSSDLTGLWFTNLHVVKRGKSKRHAHGMLTTWDCVDRKGRIHPGVLASHLFNGSSRGLCAPDGDGSITRRGYRVVTIGGKEVFEHRHVMAKVIGRPLQRHEQVHHGPKGKACNDPDNLTIRLVGQHTGHSVEELAQWLRSLGCRVFVPAKLQTTWMDKL
jgi:hypothetical protein